MVEIGEIRRALSSREPGESVSISKTEVPDLPPEFSPTLLGTPNWIAHPGAVGQYRASPALHAYEMEDSWDLHRDRYDPKENPFGHMVFDAPEVPIAGLIAAIAGSIAFWIAQKFEDEKPESERRLWFAGVVAAGVALIVGIIAYILGALVRVAMGVG